MSIELQRQSNKEKKVKKTSFGFAPVQKAEVKVDIARAGGECPYCGTTYSATAQICPECGMGIATGSCTFCGEPMPEGADLCPHCGNPSSGIECQECGTINFRNFCRKCGSALNGRAVVALERFKADPKYKQAQLIEADLKKLQDFIEGRTAEINLDVEEEVPGATLDTSALADMPSEYAALFGQKTQEIPKPVEKKTPVKRMTVQEAIAAYAAKKAEMDALLDSIVPPPELTPEEQRDFCSARQIAVTVTRTETKFTNKRYWICNFCGCRHHAPSECAEPWHGGVWITNTFTETTTTTNTTLETLKD